MLQEVVERTVDRASRLVGPGESVEVVQHVGTAGVELEVELAAAA